MTLYVKSGNYVDVVMIEPSHWQRQPTRNEALFENFFLFFVQDFVRIYRQETIFQTKTKSNQNSGLVEVIRFYFFLSASIFTVVM